MASAAKPLQRHQAPGQGRHQSLNGLCGQAAAAGYRLRIGQAYVPVSMASAAKPLQPSCSSCTSAATSPVSMASAAKPLQLVIDGVDVTWYMSQWPLRPSRCSFSMMAEMFRSSVSMASAAKLLQPISAFLAAPPIVSMASAAKPLQPAEYVAAHGRRPLVSMASAAKPLQPAEYVAAHGRRPLVSMASAAKPLQHGDRPQFRAGSDQRLNGLCGQAAAARGRDFSTAVRLRSQWPLRPSRCSLWYFITGKKPEQKSQWPLRPSRCSTMKYPLCWKIFGLNGLCGQAAAAVNKTVSSFDAAVSMASAAKPLQPHSFAELHLVLPGLNGLCGQAAAAVFAASADQPNWVSTASAAKPLQPG